MSELYSPQQIAIMANGNLIVKVDAPILKLVFDSRMVFDAYGVLFFALRGGHNNGHFFIPELYDKGVRNFVVHKDFKVTENCSDANFIFVDDTLKALQTIAQKHRQQFDIPVLAITGSNGKTIVKEWLSQALGNDEKLTRSPRSYNSQIGVPLSVWQINQTCTMAIFEAGISLPDEMDSLREVIGPTLGLITNIGAAHQENFSSLDSKLNEKLKLFQGVGTLFYCRDQYVIHKRVSDLYFDKTLLTWGKHRDSDLQLLSVGGELGTLLHLKWENKEFDIDLPFSDLVSIENSLAVILFLLYKGYSFSEISCRVVSLQPVAMRMEKKEGVNGSLIINDSYNSDLTSLEIALDFLEQQATKKGSMRTLILSDMLQTGVDEAELYPKVASLLKLKKINRLIGVGNDISKYAHCFRSGDMFFPSTDALLKAMVSLSFKNEAVLIKGARSFAFERVSERLEQQQHTTVMEINLDALINNFNFFKEQLHPQTKVLAMVKAFGYGSGSFEIAGLLQHHKVDYLGVAFADEGMELRQAGISMPIIVMNPEEKSFGQMLNYNLEPEIYSFRILKAFARAVHDNGESVVNVHIKVDTGMYRLGFFCDEVNDLIASLKQLPQVRVCSVFSHLVGSDDAVHDDFTQTQISYFSAFCDKLESGLGYGFIKHILNSAGIERFPQAQFDMVRLGIGLYGVSSLSNEQLKNVATLKTYISQIKKVEANTTIGYSRKGIMPNGGSVAILPVGYADGLNRHLSNGVGEVLVNGIMAPIIGNVCMDMCMVDVTGLDVNEGDEVVLFGDKHSISEMALKLGTIPYEILTGISRRVKRVYYRE